INPVETATINATNGDVDISGLELEVDAMLTDALRVSMRYNYLDADIEPQLNPFSGTLERFEVQSAPRHSGSLQVQYDFPSTPIGLPRLSVTYTSSDDYYQNPQNFAHNDGWDLLQARFSLSEIRLGSLAGEFEVALWGNNLTDEEYISNGVSQAISNSAMYGEPRTYGLDLFYRY
ncbi:MAG: TonB-dependent receptor, partial [Spongiibacteraceae bacterium]|nr:TonB-dependent receptor [Spongiibacteraceae bacterium]